MGGGFHYLRTGVFFMVGGKGPLCFGHFRGGPGAPGIRETKKEPTPLGPSPPQARSPPNLGIPVQGGGPPAPDPPGWRFIFNFFGGFGGGTVLSSADGGGCVFFSPEKVSGKGGGAGSGGIFQGGAGGGGANAFSFFGAPDAPGEKFLEKPKKGPVGKTPGARLFQTGGIGVGGPGAISRREIRGYFLEAGKIWASGTPPQIFKTDFPTETARTSGRNLMKSFRLSGAQTQKGGGGRGAFEKKKTERAGLPGPKKKRGPKKRFWGRFEFYFRGLGIQKTRALESEGLLGKGGGSAGAGRFLNPVWVLRGGRGGFFWGARRFWEKGETKGLFSGGGGVTFPGRRAKGREGRMVSRIF